MAALRFAADVGGIFAFFTVLTLIGRFGRTAWLPAWWEILLIVVLAIVVAALKSLLVWGWRRLKRWRSAV